MLDIYSACTPYFWFYLEWLRFHLPADILTILIGLPIFSWLLWLFYRGVSFQLECPKCHLDRLKRLPLRGLWRLLRSAEAYECMDCENRFIQIHVH